MASKNLVWKVKGYEAPPSAHAQNGKFHVLLSLWRVPRSGEDGEFACCLYLDASSFISQIRSLCVCKIVYL